MAERLHLRNVKGFGWNHKRIYRIYREPELNMRIKPRKRLHREKPEPLAVPEAPNEVWSITALSHMQSMCERGLRGRSTGGWSILPHTDRVG